MRTSKPKRIYAPRIISDHIMVREDFERLHKLLLETEGLSEVSDDMRELVEDEWPVPQTAADPRPINIIAARRAPQSTNPSSSTQAREISEITMAGATLLKGTGVSSRRCLSMRVKWPRMERLNHARNL